MNVFFISVFGTLVFVAPSNVFSEDNNNSPYLEQEELKEISQLRLRSRSASKEDKQVAQELLGMAAGFSEKENWGAAFKTYAESATVQPTTEALEGMAISLSRISRVRPGCDETLSSKVRDLSEAFLYIAAALEFRSVTKEKVGSPHVFDELIEVQRDLSGKFNECLKQ